MNLDLDLLASAYEHVVAGTVAIGERGEILVFNAAAERIFGYSASEVLGHNVNVLMPPSYAREHDGYLRSYLAGGEARIIGYGRQVEGRRKDGTDFPMHLGVGEMWVDGRRLFVGSITDLTERKSIEAQLIKAQRMEVVGQLTGGIAHDFNNLLVVIGGHAELLAEIVDTDPDGVESVESIKTATLRGASLTGQLLAFARRAMLKPAAVRLSDAIDELAGILDRTMRASIQVRIRHATDLWHASVDPSLFEIALLNLLVNARDAMPDGGSVEVTTANVTLDESSPLHDLPDATGASGDFVRVRIEDTGRGMPPDVLERALEPFFTTKDADRGSGLGLSMVYGFVKQSRGHLTIASRPGAGTSVEMYFPRVPEPTPTERSAAQVPVSAAPGRILIVEDEATIRTLASRTLRREGWLVVEAGSASEAMAALDDGPYDVLFTDIVVPGELDGVTLARRARERFAGIRVILTTGYSEEDLPPEWHADPRVELLRKPYQQSQLRDLLRRGEGDPASP